VRQFGSAVYEFDSEVVGCRGDSVPALIVKMPREFFRIQRRRHFRLRVAAEARVEVIADGAAGRSLGTVKICDLSAGGVGFFTRNPVAAGTRLRISIPSLGLTTAGEVVRVVDGGGVGSGSDYLVGAKFLDLTEEETTRITRLIFKEQMNLRRKGLA
ncbi:MAG: PilZ domain-containing protein, partial [Firmicutes bacterium]|nr:PilZ domain-containing protein [Bacillota bacterium]